ncbi:MAG: glutamyl-tRNA reductase [Nocardioidaceae bacterium]
MSILTVGASHRTAPLELLERLAVDVDGARKLRRAVLDTDHVAESALLVTCNRIEIYAEVDRFHAGVEDLTALLADHADLGVDELLPALHVHYDEAAVAHLFQVAAGLDSMVIGETQILGQLRDALRLGQLDETVGPVLNSLFQQGLRVGKRIHAETGIDRAGQSVVSVALEAASLRLGPLEQARVLIVGSGSVASLTAASVRRSGASDVVIASRTPAHAERLAQRTGARAIPLARIDHALAEVDLLISCTGAAGTVVSVELVQTALATRLQDTALVVLDLALPHDVEPAVATLPGVTLVALQTLAESANDRASQADVAAAQRLVAEEVAAFVAAKDAARVTPTVVALRSMATAVVASELERLWTRQGDLTGAQRDEITQTVRRVADKLLHEPTVRVKELAGRSPEASYAEALAELFALDPAAVNAVIGIGDPS